MVTHSTSLAVTQRLPHHNDAVTEAPAQEHHTPLFVGFSPRVQLSVGTLQSLHFPGSLVPRKPGLGPARPTPGYWAPASGGGGQAGTREQSHQLPSWKWGSRASVELDSESGGPKPPGLQHLAENMLHESC